MPRDPLRTGGDPGIGGFGLWRVAEAPLNINVTEVILHVEPSDHVRKSAISLSRPLSHARER
jgi:hypothetical protein